MERQNKLNKMQSSEIIRALSALAKILPDFPGFLIRFFWSAVFVVLFNKLVINELNTKLV
jgi:hypothetical protein